MKHLLLLLLLSFCLPVAAQTPPPNETPRSLPELLKRIEVVMQQERIPGLMLNIVTKDSVLFVGGFGYANLQTQAKVTRATRFRMGSVTKNFTALGILHLLHEGKLHLSDKLSVIAPEIGVVNQWEAIAPVQVVHLLEHTAGFDDVYLNKTFRVSGPELKGLKAVKLYQPQLVSRWRPGERMAYSNADYIVLGYLIEKLSGEPWDQYLTRHVLQPLGMRHSSFARHIEASSTQAHGYLMQDGRAIPVPFFELQGNGADGALTSTADDMARFLRFYLNDWQLDNTPWLPASYLQEMETVHSTLASCLGLRSGYGLGNHTFRLPKASFQGHSGALVGTNATFQYNRQLGIGFALALNGGYNGGRIERLVADFVTRNLPEPPRRPAVVPAPTTLETYSGYYQPGNSTHERFSPIERLTQGISLQRSGNQLVLHGRGGPDTLVAEGPHLFRSMHQAVPTVVMGTDAAGVQTVIIDDTYYQPASLAWVRVQQALLALSVLALAASVFIGLVGLVQVLRGKLPRKQLFLHLLPVAATLALAAALKLLLQPDQDFFAFASVNLTTLTIFVGTMLFGVLVAVEIVLLLRHWKGLGNPWTRHLLAFTTFGLAYLAGWLLVHGFVGARVWAW
ncbi:beta-lactamase family protein [Hymenobacter tibetensis]|uniref:Beta-lactamase family protein n=1 Tax=Hymenobacter tibetensis TaxID=497967 RepID=A0ABY4CVS8_9BACT|nr:serine hydrolase domain-containing protein [Hymenobacter tibetensis]UOG73275.1 beta-lactamase family protein [Hymenobacter tibetensis]